MKLCINGATTMPYPLQEDIVFAHKAKFEGIEIWHEKLKKYLNEGNNPVKLQEILWAAELEPVAISAFPLIAFQENAQVLQELVNTAQIAPQIDCSTIVVYPQFDVPADVDKLKAIEKFALELRKYADAVSQYKINIAFEPTGMHPCIPGPKEAMQVLDIAGRKNIGLVLDTFHLYKSAIELADIKNIPMEKLLLVHVSDVENLPREQLTGNNMVYPGLGVIPLADILKVLKEKNYVGFISVEIFREDYWKENPEKITLDAKKHLEAVLAKI